MGVIHKEGGGGVQDLMKAQIQNLFKFIWKVNCRSRAG